jgi:5-deoxy-glucuronate isomerase
LSVHRLAPGRRLALELTGREAVVVPLSGSARLDVAAPDGTRRQAALAGRSDPFAGPADTAYLPVGSTGALTAGGEGLRVAVATAATAAVHPFAVLPAAAARVDLRGAGPASRKVVNYTIGTGLRADRLLVCEVVTPGGNWSSYPPHKHDAHSDRPGAEERELEEIYYFEVAAGPSGPGFAFHRVYGTPERPIDVLAEVRTGDVVLVPHGYHGPSIAAPGYDLYYLNVMAGPAADGLWLSTDDPAHSWVRDSWAGQEIDPRLRPGQRRPGGAPTARPARPNLEESS